VSKLSQHELIDEYKFAVCPVILGSGKPLIRDLSICLRLDLLEAKALPVAVVVSLSYLFLRLDLLVIQLAAMLLSFCGHYYIDSQYHVAGSWLGRFSWFNRKQQLHFIHHRHGKCNFAVIDFFWDRLLGTYRRANLEDAL
jgi:sterol desaturase/sphingolipid hydroxylase (fatty acid hydroxylase superfamily)